MVMVEQKKEVISPYSNTVYCPHCFSVFRPDHAFVRRPYTSDTTSGLAFGSTDKLETYNETGKCPFCEKRF